MLHAFEDMARTNPRQLCFTAVEVSGREVSYSYHQARLYGSALAQCLRNAGVRRGDYVSVALPNNAAWPLLLLAAAYGNFALVAIDPFLSDVEKAARRAELEATPNTRIAYFVDSSNVAALMAQARALIDGETALSSERRFSSSAHSAPRTSLSSGPSRAGYLGDSRDHTKVHPSQLRRYATDAEEAVVHFADHQSHLFDATKRSVVLFTAGSMGKSKPVALTWTNITQSARVFNGLYSKQGRGVWQAALPFYRAEGLQVIVRSFCNRSAFVVYERYDAQMVLAGRTRLGATHLAVSASMLRDLVIADARGDLSRYTLLLLSGSSVPEDLMKRCKESRIRLHVGYGMTETAGQIAIGSLADLEKDGMRLMPGVSVRIVDQGPDGYGKLAIKGSCLCNGYFTARMATTADGFFLTGDTAQFRNGCLMVRERTDDVFVSGGENIFPAEIRRKMLSCQGVSEAYVYGALDARGERRPIAFVERSDMGMRGGGTGRQFVARLRKSLATSVSRNAMPAFIFPLEGFPRTKTGQVDTRLLENCFEERIEIVRIALHTVSVPFARPLRVGRESLATREALLVEVVDYQGRVGIGECSSFGQPLFSTEVLRSDRDFIQHVLAPRVLNSAFLHPNEVYSSLAECPGALKYPLAMSAVESALWDLYGKITKMPLWQLIGGQPTEAKGMQVRLRASAMVGLGSAQETVESVWRCAEAGYGRVVIQVVPQGAFECVNAVRQVFPDLSICLDAGQSFTEKHFDELLKLDSLGIDWIKEPLAFDCSTRTAVERFQLLSDLQERMETPICLDQSIQGTEDAYKALRFRNLRHVAVHVSRFGGIRPTLDFIRCAQAQGVKPWMDNSYDLGVSRRVLAAFQTIPGVEDRGNIGSVLRDFTNDIADPPYTVERGLVTINRAAEPHGVGCRVDDFTMGKALVKTIVVE